MKLLFITQKVDKNDDVLGAYHHWIEKIADRFEQVSVICLYKGKVETPGNVSVHSLGKEKGLASLRYFCNFYKFLWLLRRKYDAVLVHMNPIYVVLGSLIWKITGRSVFMWYNHPRGNFMARLGIILSNKVFCTSPFSFAGKFNKTVVIPVGVDINIFDRHRGSSKLKNSILCLGRISAVKNIEILIKAAEILDSKGLDFVVNIVGGAVSENDKKYLSEINYLARGLTEKGKIKFLSPVANNDTPKIYNENDIFVNLTPTGSFDKSIIEAMACGTPVLVSNKTLELFFPDDIKKVCMFEENNPQDLANKILDLLSTPESFKDKLGENLREIVVRRHSLDNLMDKLLIYIK